jgi:hypothetical protein
MFSRKALMFAALAVGTMLPVTLAAQTTSAATKPATSAPSTATSTATDTKADTPHYIRPETAQQRKDRLGTGEDPGTEPDSKKEWFRFGKKYHIERYERRWSSFENAEEGYIRPFAPVNSYYEVYQLNEPYVWVWVEEKEPVKIDPIEASGQFARYSKEELDYYQSMRSEFSELKVPESGKTLTFVDSSEGLPTNGSWRNNVAIADMNGDGFLDIIAPPERAGSNVPAIFLGDGKGKWKYWDGVKWPFGLNYGGVAAGDFNKDGHMDLAFAVHLEGLHVFLGDGAGKFTDSSAGLPNDFATRRLMVTDVDRDGYPDIVSISEGPTTAQHPENQVYSKMRVYFNRQKGKSWEGANVGDPDAKFGGDWMAIGDFNGDKYPDFLGASVYFNGTEILYLSSSAKKWDVTGARGKVVPLLAYHFAEAAGHFSSTKLDDGIISYVRSWPTNIDTRLVPDPPMKQLVGLDRISFAGKEPKRTPVARWAGARGVWGMATGDFDGDGNVDIAFTRFDPRSLEIYLSDGKGGFKRATVQGANITANTNYDLAVADVDNDGRPDLIICYEASGTTRFGARDGAIQVFLNRTPSGTRSASSK